MTLPPGFWSSLKVAATGPFGLTGYLVAALVTCLIVFRWNRLRLITKALAKVPAGDRAALLAREYGVTPRSGLSAEQWIRARKHQYATVLIVALILAAAVVCIVALLNASPNHVSGPARAIGKGNAAVTGDGNQVIINPPQEEKQNLRDKSPDKKR
jgi:hypothetical protein